MGRNRDRTPKLRDRETSTISSTHDVHGAANTVDRMHRRTIAARFARAIESAQRAHPGRTHLTLPAAGDRTDPLRSHP
jgi:hypothetical protein